MKTGNRWAMVAAAAGSLLWVGVAAGESPMSPQTSRSTGDEASSSAVRTDSAKGMSEAVTGKIAKVDADQRTIELQGKRMLKVDPSTKIERDGEKASFSDLHAGDEVRASFSGTDQTNVKRIEVLPGSGGTSHGNGTTYGGPAGTASGSSTGTVPPRQKPAGQ